mmetsp:Transcript_28265/g.59707  ORF Transcript_28265/g.59707 Transcript_28265/m.59707 type:complete len:189 (+) Transcript_28265:863-1429(+)
MFYYFSRHGKYIKLRDDDIDNDCVRITRSGTSIADAEDEWIIDLNFNAADCAVMDTCCLNRYPLEHLITLPAGSYILFLVNVEDNDMEFLRKASSVERVQKLPCRIIGEKELYQLQCTISDTGTNTDGMEGDSSPFYSLPKFKADFNSNNGGFHVAFTGCKIINHLNWRQIITHPSILMFFGGPLTMS